MSKIQFGQETYGWIMCGDRYIGKIDHMARISHQAGFAGMEPMNLQLQDFYQPEKLKATLEEHQIKLSSLAFVCDWLEPKETAAEKEESDRALKLLSHFPDAVCMLVQMPQKDRSHLDIRQKNLMLNIHEVAKKFVDKGIQCSYHPNSPDGSIWRTPEDYQKLLPQLDGRIIGWTPDVGHIAKGGMNPVTLMREFRSLINHVHYKDMNQDGSWAVTGKGIIDFETITKDLAKSGYAGWIICEDEVDECIDDPDGIALADGKYIDATLKGWAKAGS
jgi:inosose dehydratase